MRARKRGVASCRVSYKPIKNQTYLMTVRDKICERFRSGKRSPLQTAPIPQQRGAHCASATITTRLGQSRARRFWILNRSVEGR